MSDLMTLPQTAAYLNMSEKSLRWWRYSGTGPKGARLGGRVLWRKRDVDAWLDQQFAMEDDK